MALSMVFLFGCGRGEGSDDPGGEGGPGVAVGEMHLELSPDSVGTHALLQAVSPVDRSVVWVSGHAGTYARSTDGGEHWQVSVMEGAEDLQFRDVEAFDSLSAVLMSAGSGGLSRIYRTSDGGRSWDLQYRAEDPGAFLDCLAFWDSDRGLAYGDSVDEVPFILRTMDGGERWARIPPSGLPEALEGEGGFAASGTCLITGEGGRAWVATGAGPRPRVLMTEDWGESWRVAEVPVVGGASSGLTTLRIGSDGWGIALGGTIGEDTLRTRNVAVTQDGGRSWDEAPSPAMTGPVYGSALVDLGRGYGVVAVGPMGLDWALAPELQWQEGDSLSYWAVAFADSTAGWAVGPEGRLARLAFRVAR
jgi:photosystem II stability/assembly factor-like uncharacterized protein